MLLLLLLKEEEYCPTCFKKIVLQDNIEEKKENFCSKECEFKAAEDKRLFNNIFTYDETSEKSYVSSISSCYGISSYDIESEVVYYEDSEIETIHIAALPQNFEPQNNMIKKNDDDISSKNTSYNDKNDDIDSIIFNYTSNSNNENSQVLEPDKNSINQVTDLNNDIKIIKVNKFLDSDDDDNDNENNEHYNQSSDFYQCNSMDIDRESFLQFFDTKTKSTTTSGVNEKIISFYKQLCWENEYFYPLLILKLLILIIQDELCFKKKIKFMDLSSNIPLVSYHQEYPHSQHPKFLISQNPKINNTVENKYKIGNNKSNQPQKHVKNKNDKPIIYTLWDHIESFPYIKNYSKVSTDINIETKNEFSKYDLKFFNLIHTLFYDALYEFEDCKYILK